MERKSVLFALFAVFLAASAAVATVSSTVLAAPLADTDEDGLMNARETLQGTGPTASDTDNDGFPDGVEVKLEKPIPGSTPLRKDIYVEMDYTEACGLTREEIKKVEQVFERAPVENPDGSRGIDLHIEKDDRLNTTLGDGQGFFRIQDNFDHQLQGHYFLIGTIHKGTSSGTTAVFRCNDPGTFVHELGHSMGLDSFRGIDSYYVSFNQYRSRMNYNAPQTFLNYSDGSHGKNDYDDWGFIEDHIETAPVTRLCERVNASSPECDRKIPVRNS